jgi:hypothetical protein
MKKEVRLRLTTTKLQKASDCKRRLILEEVFGFPEPRNPAFLFGSVTHAVLERWFKTRGTGIVPYHSDTWENGGPFYGQKIGAKVDLFPPGWESNMDRDGTRSSIGPEEIPRVMGAIEAAFEAGYMDPIFDEVVEDKFTMLVIPGVTMTSLSDAYSIVGLRVLDHKTVAAQKYMKTPEDLSQNLQMAVFAKHFLDQYKKRYPHQEGPPWVDLVHNGLGKYPSSATGRHQAYRTSVRVTVATIEDNWKKIQRIAEESLSVVDEVSRSGWSEDDWQKIPGAKNTGICEKYDGCPLYDICHRGIAPSTVRKRIESQRRGSVPLQQSTMVISYTPPVAAQAPPIMQPQAAPAPPPPTVSSWPRLVSPTDHPENVWQTGPMPWASPQCPICRGAGTVKLKPCPACIENHDGEPVLELVRGQDGTPWLFFQGNKVTTDPNPQPSQAPQASQEPQDESDGEQEVQFGSKPKAKRGRKPKAEAAPVLEVALVPDPTPVPAQGSGPGSRSRLRLRSRFRSRLRLRSRFRSRLRLRSRFRSRLRLRSRFRSQRLCQPKRPSRFRCPLR